MIKQHWIISNDVLEFLLIVMFTWSGWSVKMFPITWLEGIKQGEKRRNDKKNLLVLMDKREYERKKGENYSVMTQEKCPRVLIRWIKRWWKDIDIIWILNRCTFILPSNKVFVNDYSDANQQQEIDIFFYSSVWHFRTPCIAPLLAFCSFHLLFTKKFKMWLRSKYKRLKLQNPRLIHQNNIGNPK